MAKNLEKVNSNADEKVLQCVRTISEATKADIYVISGNLYKPVDEDTLNSIKAHKSQPNAFLLLTTLGGDADVAYRVARCFQHSYKDGEFIMFVPSICKSAGTLVTIGATELVMDDCAELGPLDVQLLKPDEFGEVISGLTPVKALEFLQEHTFEYFEHCFLNVIVRSSLQITTKTASSIATELTAGMFNPVYAQLDPLKLGEYHRNMMVASEYGKRLLPHGNLKSENELKKLIYDYPSHSFVIDKEEAEQLFKKVRKPTDDEAELAKALKPTISELGRTATFYYIDTHKKDEAQQETSEKKVS
jgi:hypothetical protein